jgi:RNA polymerase sigma-70 factor (ECF subfamily)
MYPTRLASRTSGVASEAADERPVAEERRAIERVLSGDPQAFRLLVERYQRGVYAVVYRMVQNAADADDLAQQAFLSAYDALASFQLDRKFSSWLYRIAVNLAKDHLKSKKRGEVLLDADGVCEGALFAGRLPAADEPARLRQRAALLERALAQLSLADREVLILKDIEELPYEEIKQILGKPITALKIRVVRARERLAAALRQVVGGEDG